MQGSPRVLYNRRPNSAILEWIEMTITIYGIVGRTVDDAQTAVERPWSHMHRWHDGISRKKQGDNFDRIIFPCLAQTLVR
jgi:hypothetical protein